MAKVIKIENLPKVFKKFKGKSEEQYRKAALEGIIMSLPILVERSPVDTGEYASSWDYEEQKEKKRILLGNFAPHSPIIEKGARPFSPPIAPLLAWAKRVLKDPSQPPNYSPQVRALAWNTKKKIEREGMEPRHILEDSLPEVVEKMKKALKAPDPEKMNLQ